ncbi:hypothetical protein MAR_021286, partial [Mya arenaria]
DVAGEGNNYVDEVPDIPLQQPGEDGREIQGMQCTPQCQASGKGDMCYPARTAGRAYQADVDHVTILNSQDVWELYKMGSWSRDTVIMTEVDKTSIDNMKGKTVCVQVTVLISSGISDNMDSNLPRDERPGQKWAAASGRGQKCWEPVTRGGGRDTDAGSQSQEVEGGTQMLGPSHKRWRAGHRCWDPVIRGGGRDTDTGTQSQEVEVRTQMLGPSHKRWRSGHRCWDPVTRGGGRDTDAGTQSQEVEVRTQMLGPSHKRRRSGHRCWDPVTRGGGRDTDAGTQSQEEVRTQMLGPSHKRRRSGHRCWDPVTRGGRDRDAVTQSQEVEVGTQMLGPKVEVRTQMLGPSHKRRRSGHRCWDPVTRGGGQDTDAGTQSQRRRSGHRCWDPVTRGGGQDTDAGTQSQEEEKRYSPKQSGIQGVEVGPVISEEVQPQTKWHPECRRWPSDIRRGPAPKQSGIQSVEDGPLISEEKRNSPKQSGIKEVEVDPVVSEEVQPQTKWHQGSRSCPSGIRRGPAPNKVASRKILHRVLLCRVSG